MLREAGVRTLVDARRLPRSRGNPQDNHKAIEETALEFGLR